jgi:hypothetical protein
MTPARVTPEIRLSPQDFGRATRIRNALVADLGGPTNVSNGEAILADFGGLAVLLAQRAAKLQDWELFKTWLGQARATLTTLGLSRRARSVERDARDVWQAMRESAQDATVDAPAAPGASTVGEDDLGATWSRAPRARPPRRPALTPALPPTRHERLSQRTGLGVQVPVL